MAEGKWQREEGKWQMAEGRRRKAEDKGEKNGRPLSHFFLVNLPSVVLIRHLSPVFHDPLPKGVGPPPARGTGSRRSGPLP